MYCWLGRDVASCVSRSLSLLTFPSTMLRSVEITATITQAATDAGFDLVGVAPVEDAPELEYFPRWIAQGHAGEMKYLEARDEQGRLKRASLSHAAPWARSVVVCAINYNTAQPYSTQASDSAKNQGRGWISRYAWGQQDYHDSVMLRLRQVEVGVETRLRTRRPGHALLRRHGAYRRTRGSEVCRDWVDREEHLHHQSEAGLLALPGRDAHLARTRT